MPGEGPDPTIPEQDSPMRLLEEMGITGKALESARLYPERIEQAFELVNSIDGIRNKNRYIAKVLINGVFEDDVKQIDESPRFMPEMQSELTDGQPDIAVHHCAHCGERNFNGHCLNWNCPSNKPKPQVDAIQADASICIGQWTMHSGKMQTPAEAWSAAYNQLELQLDRASFDTWIKEAKLIKFEDDVFVVLVRNNYAKDMLQHRLYRNVRRVVSDVIGTTAELRFIVAEEVNAS